MKAENTARDPDPIRSMRPWFNVPVKLRGRCASVLVDPEESHSVELRQLGQEDAEQRAGVDEEVCGIVFRVKAGQNVPVTRHRKQNDLRA